MDCRGKEAAEPQDEAFNLKSIFFPTLTCGWTKKTEISDTSDQNYFPSWVCLTCHPTMLEEEKKDRSLVASTCTPRLKVRITSRSMPHLQCCHWMPTEYTELLWCEESCSWWWNSSEPFWPALLAESNCTSFAVPSWVAVPEMDLLQSWTKACSARLQAPLVNQLIYALTLTYGNELWVIPCTLGYNSAKQLSFQVAVLTFQDRILDILSELDAELTASLCWQEPDEVIPASVQDAFWLPPSGGMPDMSNWKGTLLQHRALSIMYLF